MSKVCSIIKTFDSKQHKKMQPMIQTINENLRLLFNYLFPLNESCHPSAPCLLLLTASDLFPFLLHDLNH